MRKNQILKLSRGGFTLLELLVVIAIIGLLSSVVAVTVNQSRGKARDARRKADLVAISQAMELYYEKHGTYYVYGAGFAYAECPQGCGGGWFGLEKDAAPPGYIVATSRALYNEGIISEPIVQSPYGGKSAVQAGSTDVPTQGPYGYMLYVCDGGESYSVSAYLENPTPRDQETICTSCQSQHQGPPFYGKNYAIGNKGFPKLANCPQDY